MPDRPLPDWAPPALLYRLVREEEAGVRGSDRESSLPAARQHLEEAARQGLRGRRAALRRAAAGAAGTSWRRPRWHTTASTECTPCEYLPGLAARPSRAGPRGPARRRAAARRRRGSAPRPLQRGDGAARVHARREREDTPVAATAHKALPSLVAPGRARARELSDAVVREGGRDVSD